MREHRDPAWMCWRCGYAMDTHAHVDPKSDTSAKENDLSMCLNCGALYTRHGESWKPSTSAEINSISPELKTTLLRALAVRRLTITEDLAKRKGNA